MTTKTKIISYENRVIFFWTLAAICLALLFVYIYSINATARNIAERQNWERQITRVNAELNSLEFSYIELKNEVTLELAKQYGFREASNPIYVSRGNGSSLSFNTLDR